MRFPGYASTASCANLPTDYVYFDIMDMQTLPTARNQTTKTNSENPIGLNQKAHDTASTHLLQVPYQLF
jgi:hypothetical protein